MTKFHFAILIAVSIASFSVGVAMIIASVLARSKAKGFIEKGIKNTATITDIQIRDSGEYMHRVAIVMYEINGILYRKRLDRYSSGMEVGQTIPIRYMPDDPYKIAYSKNVYHKAKVFLLASIIGFAVAATMVVIALSQIKP
jgi:hypothetical protein